MHPDVEALLSAYVEGRFEEAMGLAKSFVGKFPDHGLGWMVLGAVLMQAGKNEEALLPLQKGAGLSPDNADAHNNLGVAYLNLGRLDEARLSLERALQISPDYAEAHNNLGNLFRRFHRLDEAERCYCKAIEISPEYAAAHGNLAVLLRDRGRLLDARESALRAITSEDADAHNNLGAILLDMGSFDEAEMNLRHALRIEPNHPMAHNNLASVLKEMMRRDEAEAVYREMLSISPDNADALHGLANLRLESGEVDDALILYERILKDHPLNTEVRHSMSLSGRKSEENFAALAKMDEPSSVKDAVFRHYALGKCFDDRGEYDQAFLHYSKGARLKRSLLDYHPKKTAERFESFARDFDRSVLENIKGMGHPSELPIFVLGMPRSGTTLIEQIIASHPEVEAGGELPDLLHVVERNQMGSIHQKISGWGKEYIRSLQARAPDARRITDKMPANFFAIGLIHTMLPNARIMHVRRDPMDTCVSCFTQLFNRGHEYSYDLEELGRYYAGYASLMEHWRRTLPLGSFLDVDYEEVVLDPEGQARRMIEYCGLDWSDACLDFHNNGRPVQTASMVQVRKPMYSSSIGRWKRYGSHLAPLIDALGNSGASP